MSTTKFRVRYPIDIGGRRFNPGDVIELTADAAAGYEHALEPVKED